MVQRRLVAPADTEERDAHAANQESDWTTRSTCGKPGERLADEILVRKPWRGDKVPLFLAYTCIITCLFMYIRAVFSIERDTINYFHISPLDAFSLFLHQTVFVTVCTAQLVS